LNRILAVATGAAILISAVLIGSAALAQGERDLPAPGTALEPGRYASDAVGPRIAFSVDEGWLAGPAGPGPIFTLVRADEPGTVVSITRFDGDVFVDSCDPTSLSTVEVSVPRLMSIIAGNPYLNPGSIMPIEVDGREGLALDVATPAYTECRLQWLLLWALPVAEGGEFVQVADQQTRFIALDVEGVVVVVAIESLPGVPFGGLLEAATELVESMRLEPEPEASAEPTPVASSEPTLASDGAPTPGASAEPAEATAQPTPDASPGATPVASSDPALEESDPGLTA
jgi:hypothetical protein